MNILGDEISNAEKETWQIYFGEDFGDLYSFVQYDITLAIEVWMILSQIAMDACA